MRDETPVFLVGFMGCGKTTVAEALAGLWGWDSVDTDAVVVAREGRSIEAIFEQSGEEEFRRAEWEALRTLAGARRTVVATGGGLPIGALQRRWLGRQGRTVWLDAPLEVCRERLGTGAGRPLGTAADPAVVRALYERRRVVYALAQLRVAVGDEPPAEVARRVAARLDPGAPAPSPR